MNPAICAALGAAAACYGFPPLRDAIPRWPLLAPAFIVLLALPAGLFQALAFFPVPAPAAGSPPPGRRFRRWYRGTAAFAAGFCLGLAAAVPRPVHLGLTGERITGLYGVLREDPRAFPDGRGMGSLDLSAALGKEGLRASSTGTIPVYFPAEAIPRLRDFGRGAELYLEGSLMEGERGPRWKVRAVHIVRPAPPVERFRTAVRLGILEKLVPGGGRAPVWGPLAAALLLGARDGLDTELARNFQAAGCSHILALSGMHLGILSALIAFLLRKPLGIRAASLIGGVLIVVYVYLAGAQPSLVRAAIMYLLGVAALCLQVKTRPLSLLALAFLIQLLIQPGSFRSVSFILSYLALGGILVTGVSIHEILRGRVPGPAAPGLSASLGAFIATAAVSSFYFGVLRPVGIAAGLLITPLITVFMIGALGTLALCFFAPSAAVFPGIVLSRLAELQGGLVSLAARAPGIPAARPLPALLVSLVLALGVYYGARRRVEGAGCLTPFD